MPSSARTRFHLSLNTSDLRQAVAFYRVLFGLEPAKLHDDYAKFELTEPPVVFALAPHPIPPGGSLSHLGLRVPDAQMRQQVQARLETAGLKTDCQEGTVCGYARQNKCWVEAPDRVFWEVYEIEEEVDPAVVPRTVESISQPVAETGPVIWEHYVTSPLPERIPHDDGSVDEVRLVGSFNAGLDDGQRRRLLGEAWRVLKPGGTVMTHGLMADRPFPAAQPALPGLGWLVARIPLHTEPLDAFRSAGFVGMQFVKFTEAPWFVHDGVELREVKLAGTRPAVANDEMGEVIYKGPFCQSVDESGRVFHRGQTMKVPLAHWHLLRQGAAANQFLFVQPGAACEHC